MRAKDDLRLVVEQILNRRESRGDALVVPYFAVFGDRDVKVHAHEYPLAGYVYVLNGHFCHSFLPPFII
ncbi:hypothetical protein SDC9_107394 [bioreactor metagenome]|uniref:Uncharacterized protein n=1 Tax=bioreactor metagenome TaxID=1076179 RepID=A0A645BBI1_9ZZZZ